MFSMTTMASSTTSPVASVMPKSVSVLIEKPSSLTNPNVPMSDTGIVIAGISVVRQFCRNRNMTSTTSAMASASVVTTSRIDSATTVVVSKATSILSPGGKRSDNLLISASTSRYTCSAFAVGPGPDEAIDVVAHEQRVVLALLGVGRGGEHEVGRHLLDRDPDLLHLVGQPAFRLRNAVLHVHGGDVEVARDVEGDDDCSRA